MTDQEIITIKYNLSALIKNQIEARKGKLQVLRTYQTKLEKAKSEEDLDKIYDDFIIMFALPEEIPKDEELKARITKLLEENIEILKNGIQTLRTYQSQTAATQDEYELKKIHDSLAEMIGVSKPNQQ